MNAHLLNSVCRLRASLHGLAERSGEETKTKAALMAFLRSNTSLRLDDFGQWFCAVHEEALALETIAFRADMDALPFGESAAHHCGHDGHSAVLCGLGLLLEGRQLGRNIVLIFQHAEENGMGGGVCCQALKKYEVSRVYAFHNAPPWQETAILIRHGTFACASRGMTAAFKGLPSHAAYPDAGRNPGFAAARFISALPALTEASAYRGLAMATLVGEKVGEKAFGIAAGEAEVWLTLRAWYDDDLKALTGRLEERARAEAARDGETVCFSYTEGFPATVNDEKTLSRVLSICRQANLNCVEVPEPFRWSEDFGHYGADADAVMLGIGAGENWPQLHTQDYVFNDKIIETALTLFLKLAERG